MTQVIEKSVSDEQCIAKWKAMLEMFEKIIKGDPPVEKVKDKLLELRAAVINSNLLTERQKEALMARCDNYVTGNYGKDAKKKDYIENKKD